MLLGPGDNRVIADITDALVTLRLGSSDGIADVLPRIREVLDTDCACVYSLAPGTTGWELMRFDEVGFPARFPRAFAALLAATSGRYGIYHPGRPEPAQRNRVIESSRLLDRERPEQNALMQQLFDPNGLGRHNHVRILLCEGSSLLGWFGGLTPEIVTPRQKRILRALARPMHQRLLAARRFQRDQLAAAAFDALLEALARPAFLLDARGGVRETNAAGRRLLAKRDREIRTALVEALASRPTSVPVRLRRLQARGMSTHWLAIVDIDRVEARVAATAERCRLTPREAEVLLWIARGATNQRIAAELACSERTVEAHVANLFRKTDVASRTELVALVLT